MTDSRTYRPRAPIRIHWQGLAVYRKGELMEGAAKVEALQKWRRAEDFSVYVFPGSYGPQNIDWTGLPLRPQDLKK